MTKKFLQIAWVVAVAVQFSLAWAGGDLPSKFTNQGSVINTRHNLTMRNASGVSPLSGYGTASMDFARNNYGEVCVYCHTPHGANANVAAPLWNRNMSSTTYTTYDQLNTVTLTQTVYQPGAASLPCLSCHDGLQAVDAIINMPGSARYSATTSEAFLDSWPTGNGDTQDHLTLNANPTAANSSSNPTCLICHVPGSYIGKYAADFTAAAIGTDLRNDHPIGVAFPATNGVGTDWNTPGGSKIVGILTTRFFDENGNGRMDKDDIRLYDSGNDAAVECASCHDPHGVPGPGGTFNKTFLRKPNTQSGVCLTCHSK